MITKMLQNLSLFVVPEAARWQCMFHGVCSANFASEVEASTSEVCKQRNVPGIGQMESDCWPMSDSYADSAILHSLLI